MTRVRLAIHTHPAPRPTRRPPLFFVHGGYTHAGSWQLNFIPFFNAQGYDCYAIDLPGHGDSGGREQLHGFGLDDYADDLARALADLDQAAVLIGHSMGTVVIDRYLSRADAGAVAVALLAPVPPTGTGGSAARLAVQVPGFFEELPNAVNKTLTPATLQVMTSAYFSPAVRPDEIERFMPLIGEESDQAVAEMATLPFRRVSSRLRIPALAMSGSADAVFPASMLHFIAAIWQARSVVVDGAGHMLILDPQWPQAAQSLLDWLDTLAPSARAADDV